MERIQAEIFRLQDVFLGLVDRDRYQPVWSTRTNRSTILSLVCPGDTKELERELIHRMVYCTARGGYLRFAPHCYTDDDEVKKAARTLNDLAR